MKIFVRGYIENVKGSFKIKISKEDLYDVEGLRVGDKLYVMTISTPYGCIMSIAIDLYSKKYLYGVITMFNPLDPKDQDLVNKIINERRLGIYVEKTFEQIYELNNEDVEKIMYNLEKARECDYMRGVKVDLDKAFEWIQSMLA
ncbi:MAG: hypothetical protein LM581_04390 [Desulfurococcales archaeon]|jgi:hypothetical protein|nr:hypothetical protein [Desulfurococcales archaeon]